MRPGDDEGHEGVPGNGPGGGCGAFPERVKYFFADLLFFFYAESSVRTEFGTTSVPECWVPSSRRVDQPCQARVLCHQRDVSERIIPSRWS